MTEPLSRSLPQPKASVYAVTPSHPATPTDITAHPRPAPPNAPHATRHALNHGSQYSVCPFIISIKFALN